MSYKKKNIILAVVFVLICGFSYQFSIKTTLENKVKYEDLTTRLNTEKQLKQNISRLTQHKSYLDSLLKVHNISTTNLQNELLKSLNTLGERHQCKISSFEEPHLDSIGSMEHTYNRFSLKGNYKQLIHSIYDLDYEKNLGQLVSVNLKTEQDYKHNQTYLTADILLKNTQ